MTPFQRERAACAYFFACAGLAYGIFTARMPALKELTQATDGQIGFLLLAFGGASFCGLLTSRPLIERLGTRLIVGISSLGFMLALTLAALAPSYAWLVSFCLVAGLATGFCDVGMNAQGMVIEKRYGVLCMAFLHACFSLGGVVGALAGSLCAWLTLSPFLNFLLAGGTYLILWPWSFGHVIPGASAPRERRGAGKIPLLIYLYGFLSMLCYVSEGSVGEWGSVLLHSVKGASQQQAALVFAAFSVPMVLCRFVTDRLRARIPDFYIVFAGALLGCAAMSIVLLSPWPGLCLAGYFCMGIGFAPIVPILYSRAGSAGGISVGRASSAMSLLSYTGLLFFPPFLGMLGDAVGLDNALWVITACCLCIVLGSFTFRRAPAS